MDLRTVKMLKDERGSPDGVHLRPYYAGKSYDIPEGLAKAFVVDMLCAEYVDRADEQADSKPEPEVTTAKPQKKPMPIRK